MSDEAPTIEPGEYESADGKQRVKVVRLLTCDDGSELAYVEIPNARPTYWLIPQMFLGWKRLAPKTPWAEHGWVWKDAEAES